MHALEDKLSDRISKGIYRQLKIMPPLIDFASNDYLGLARSHLLAERIKREWTESLSGSTGSRLLTGNSTYAVELEERIAAFHGYEAGLLFGCGYLANIGLLSAVAVEGDTILYDSHLHASMHDGLKLCRAKCVPYRHLDPDHAEKRLKGRKGPGRTYICTASLFPTDGTVAPLRELACLAQQYDAHLLVDEAHGIGTTGPQGKGYVEAMDIRKHVFATVVTFGKALGVHGAIVLGSKELINILVNFARTFIYTTAPPYYNLAAIKCSYEIFPGMDRERDHLSKLIGAMGKTNSVIQPFRLKGCHSCVEASNQLAEQGFDVRAVLPPTVRQGSECLRICLHVHNTMEDLLRLKSLLNAMEGAHA